MNILHLVYSLDPRAGGMAEGVRQGGVMLQALGHHVEAVTMDAPDAAFLKDYPLTVHALGPAKSTYGYHPGLVQWLRERAPKFDAVIVNGIWQFHSLATWRALRHSKTPYYVYVHGMLDPWFKHTYPKKHLKKWLYWPWGDYRVLRDARAVLYTTEDERILARQSFWLYRANEAVVTYGTQLPPQDHAALSETFFAQFPALRGKRLVLFLGRVTEKKGCDLLLRAFARVAGDDPDLHLVMAGPDDHGYTDRLRAEADTLGIGTRVTWAGMLAGDAKWGAFHASETFALPSHQENFGVAVAEALGCGLPVLISDKINIWREVQAGNGGFVAADTVEGAEKTLRAWLALDPAARQTMRDDARALFLERFTVDAMARELLRVLQPSTHTPRNGTQQGLAAASQ